MSQIIAPVSGPGPREESWHALKEFRNCSVCVDAPQPDFYSSSFILLVPSLLAQAEWEALYQLNGTIFSGRALNNSHVE